MSPDLAQWTMAAGAGLAIGVLSGLMGVGGGYFLVATCVLLLGLTQHQGQGVALAVIVPTALVGAFVHWRQGNVRLRTAGLIALGAMVGGFISARLVQFVPPDVLRVFFGVFLLYFGFRSLGVDSWLRRQLSGGRSRG